MKAISDAILPDPLSCLRETGRLTRADLYEATWRLPIDALASHLAISDRGLGKLCDRFEIPRPGRGDWQKIAAGKRVRRPKLPVSARWAAEIVVLTQGDVDARRRYGRETGLETPLLEFWRAEVSRQMRARRAKPTPRSEAWAVRWLSPNGGGVWSAQPNAPIKPKLQKKAEARLAKLVSILLAEAERLGATLSRESTERSLHLQHAAGELRCDVTLDVRQYRRALTKEERSERFRDPSSTWTQVKEASGGICVKLHGSLPSNIPQRWADTAEQPTVEARLPEIVGTIATAFEEQRRRATEQSAQAERARAREEERARRAALDEERKARRARLMAASRAHRDAQDLRLLIDAVRDQAILAGEADAFRSWEAWAMKTIAELDPLGSLPSLTALLGDCEQSYGAL